jgi:hypothetical protein
LPNLSDSKEDEEEFDYQMTLGLTLCSMRSSRHTSTTHRQERVVVSSDDNDDDDGSDGHAAGGDDVDWDNIDEEKK